MPTSAGINNKEPGDQFYPDYSRIVTLRAAVPVKKGHLYTVETGVTNQGQLIGFAVAAVNGVSEDYVNTQYGHFESGLYQAMSDAAAGELVQCFAPGSRVGLWAGSGIVRGQYIRVDQKRYNDSATDMEPDKPRAVDPLTSGATIASERSIAGRVFDIYTEGASGIGSTKDATAPDDIIIVELGMR